MRIILLLLTLWCTTAHVNAQGFIPCPDQMRYYKSVREFHDERVAGLFTDLVKLTGIKDKKFALCESEEFSPGIFPVNLDGSHLVLVLPRSLSEFSDRVIRGVIAHELAHASRMHINGGKTVELMADQQAAEWVGIESVVEALRAMDKNIKRFPKWQQDLGKHMLQYRLNALVYGLYEVY